MKTVESHRPVVCARNMATGMARTAWRTPRYRKFLLAVSVTWYLLLGSVVRTGFGWHAAWDVFFTSAWTFLWVYLPEIID